MKALFRYPGSKWSIADWIIGHFPEGYEKMVYNTPSKLFQFDNRTGDKIHPTQKPVALYQWIFKNYAKPGFKILDTHLGSGSSRIAAYDAGLDFVGYEIDKDYFDKQEQRFQNHIAQMSLFVN